MRVTLVALVALALPGVAAAQIPLPSVGSTPLPTIGLPLPPIGLPLPTITPMPKDSAPAPPVAHGRRPRPQPVFFVPVFDWYYGYPYPPAPAAPPPREERAPEPITGTLRLYVEPEQALQVFVNGYFVGTPSDFDSALELEAGVHTIELSAPGYESIKLTVKIDGTRPVTYRGSLTPLTPKPESSTAPAPLRPSTLYFIPGCYLGNIDPKSVKLPEDCDLSQMITRPAGSAPPG